MSLKDYPKEQDKKKLTSMINELTDEETTDIFFKYILPLEKNKKKIYTIAGEGVLFDLNDLPNEIFGELNDYVNLLIEHLERKKLIEAADVENKEMKGHFNKKIETNLNDIINGSGKINLVDVETSPETKPSYEDLRISALSECDYSTYYKSKQEKVSIIHPDNKILNKTIYSDYFNKDEYKKELSPGENIDDSYQSYMELLDTIQDVNTTKNSDTSMCNDEIAKELCV